MKPARTKSRCQTARANRALDIAEAKIASMKPVDCPLVHRFMPGMYVREIFIPKGTVLTSATHKTVHPFVVLSGSISVWSEEEKAVRYDAPHFGVTMPGTRRMLYAHRDTVWLTFHATKRRTPDGVAEDILVPRENKLLKGLVPMFKAKKSRDKFVRYGKEQKCLSAS